MDEYGSTCGEEGEIVRKMCNKWTNMMGTRELEE
jgi:hypothetical protein